MTKDKKLRFGLVGDDFRKSDDKGQGYQPMLYDLKGAKIQAEENLIKITIDFDNGGEQYLFIDLQIQSKRRILFIYFGFTANFSLFLQFYLQKQVLTAQQLKIEKERLTAELMVSLALKRI